MWEGKNGGPKSDGRSMLLHGGRGALGFLFWAVLFGVSYTQPPLYYSNQNQYFLHGLAHGGLGFLNEDWLANTADPTPVFSALVACTYRYLSEWLFYVYYFLILGVYFHALLRHLRAAQRSTSNRREATRFHHLICRPSLGVAALVLSATVRRGLSLVLPSWRRQSIHSRRGLAAFRLRRPARRVRLLVLEREALSRRDMVLAGCGDALDVSSAGGLFDTVVLLCPLPRKAQFRAAFGWRWALALVSPVLVYNLRTFTTSGDAFREAQHLLAHFRIPHHADPDRWLDGIACIRSPGLSRPSFLSEDADFPPVLVLPFFCRSH